MHYSLIAIGDSLTQGFRSLAVNREFQESSFPFQIYQQNKELFSRFVMPEIKAPGYPINLEYVLYRLQEFDSIELAVEELRKEIFPVVKNDFTNKKTNNNLGIVGFTAEEIYSSNFNNSSSFLNKVIVTLENKNFLSGVSTLINLTLDGISSIFSKHFIGLSFSRIVFTVLGGNENTELHCAKQIFAEDRLAKRESLVTYWAGANDIIGALLSGDKNFISDSGKVLEFIEKTVNSVLSEEGTTLVIADIPNIKLVPFINRETMKPIFPMYSEMSEETWLEIGAAVNSINFGIYKIVEKNKKLFNERIELVEVNSLFDKMCASGQKVLLADGSETVITAEYIGTDHKGKLSKGGIFSLDGVHPGATGYAILGNEFIRSFNRLGKNLCLIDIDTISVKDKIINQPPKYINQFLDINSTVNSAIKKLGVYAFISTYIMAQFNLNNNS